MALRDTLRNLIGIPDNDYDSDFDDDMQSGNVEQEEEEQNGKLLWENVFVQQVFDRNGAAIGGDDGTTPAQRVNIYMEKERVADFYAALAQGSLRVVKAEDTDRQEE